MATILDPVIVTPEDTKKYELTQDDKETLIKGSTEFFKDLSHDSLQVLQNTYGEIKGTKFFEVLTNAKFLGLDFAMSWDDSKSTGENIANFTGSLIQGGATSAGATAGLVLIAGTPFIGVGAISTVLTIGITYGLKKVGIDLGDTLQDLYSEYIDTTIKISNIAKGDKPLGSIEDTFLVNQLKKLEELKLKLGEVEKQVKDYIDNKSVNENNPIKVELNKDNSIEIKNSDNTKSIISNGVKTNYDENNNQVSSVSLKSGQTISHVAISTKFSSLDLLEYNDLTLEQAKNLPVGYEVAIPKDVRTIDTEYGKIKIFDRVDGTNYILIPNSDGTKTKLSTFIDGNNEYASYEQSGNGSIIVSFNERMIIANNDGYHFDSYGLENKLNIEYKQSDNGNLEVKSFTVKNSITLEELLNTKTSLNLDDVAFVNNLDKNMPLQIGQQLIIPKGESVYVDSAYGKVRMIEVEDGSYVIESPNEDGTKTIYATSKNAVVEYNPLTKEFILTLTDENGNVIRKIEQDEKGIAKDSADINWNGVLNTAINQIGSLIIMNNQDFSNIEKIAVSTTVSTIADFATYKGTAEFNTTDETISNLQGAVVSFAVSSFFAKNDNISDILGMDGTFVGGLIDYTAIFTTGYAINSFIDSYQAGKTISEALSQTTQSITSLADAFSTALGGAVGGYLGSALANEIMGWDTKEEAMGASIGSALGTVTAILLLNPATFWLGLIVSFGGSFIGNIVGGIIGGLFGKKSPPPPTAKATYEFDEETESYNLISSSSSNGGNKQAMINIGKAFANHLENMFNLPGGQLIDSDFLPNIKVNQVKNTVTINGQSGSFDDVNQIMADLLVNHIPFINIENGDEYILRALNRTNESFQEANPNLVKGRGNLEEYNFIFQKSMNNTNYKNNKIINKIS